VGGAPDGAVCGSSKRHGSPAGFVCIVFCVFVSGGQTLMGGGRVRYPASAFL